jgi:4-aminobutyrate aminotransferase-like enzyme
LLQAIELVEDRQTKVPAAAATARAMEAAREQGLLLGKGGMYGNVLRLSPPMNIGRADVDNFFGMLDKTLAAVGTVAAGGVR